MSQVGGSIHGFCPQCGGAVDPDARFCKHCAYDLAQLAPDSSADLPKVSSRTNSRILYLAALAAVGLLVFALVGIYLYKRNRAQSTTAASSPTPSVPTIGEKAHQVEDRILRNEALSESDLAGLSSYELRVLRNVHFARYGRKYDQGGELGGYFYTRAWYRPSDSYNENMITSTDKANVNLIVLVERQSNLVTSTSNTNGNANSQIATGTPSPAQSETASSSGGLTNGNVQRALRTFMGDFTKGGEINVEGVQELPNQNAATADLRFVNWICSTTYEGGLSKQRPPPITYDRYGMPSSTFGLRLKTYNTAGLAVLKRYNDGRWVLKKVRIGSGFNTVTVSGTMEVR